MSPDVTENGMIVLFELKTTNADQTKFDLKHVSFDFVCLFLFAVHAGEIRRLH